MHWFGKRADDCRVSCRGICCQFCDTGTRYRQCVFQKRCKFVQHGRNAACIVESLHRMRAGGLHITDVRDILADLVEVIKGEGDACLLSDCHQVQDSVCGSAKGHVHPHSVAHALKGDDVTGLYIIPDEVDHALTAHPGNREFFGVHGGNCGTPGEGHTEGLCHAGHRICGIEALAAAAAGHRTLFEGDKVCFIHGACRYFADTFKDINE